jgi:hypothetical protein
MISQPDLVTLGPLLLLFQLDVVCVFFSQIFSEIIEGNIGKASIWQAKSMVSYIPNETDPLRTQRLTSNFQPGRFLSAVSTHAVLLFFQRMIRCEVPTF